MELDSTIEQGLIQSGQFSRDQIFGLAKTDLNFFAALVVPEIFVFLFPEIYVSVWQLITEKAFLIRDFTKLCLGLPRGFAKTMLMKLYIVWCIIFTNKKFFLVVCATATLAENFISDVFEMLDHQNVRETFGDWRIALEKDTQSIKVFSFMGKHVTVAGLGAGGSPRGLNLKFERPDVIITDDMQTVDNSESTGPATKLYTWLLGTLMKTKSPFGCLTIYVGNMYAGENCILKKLKKNKNWISFIVGGILDDGTSLWEELHPLEQLLAEFQSDMDAGHPEIFMCEVMNDPDAGISGSFDISKIPVNPFENDTGPSGKAIIIDVARDLPTSDDTTIGMYYWFDGKPVCMEMEKGKFSPGDTIKKSLRMAFMNNVPLIAVESVAYQASLLWWFEQVRQALGIEGLYFVEVTTMGMSKLSRIVRWYKSMLANEEFLSSKVRAAVTFELSQIKPGKKNNVDNQCDNCAYAHQVQSKYFNLTLIPLSTENIEYESQREAGELFIADTSSF